MAKKKMTNGNHPARARANDQEGQASYLIVFRDGTDAREAATTLHNVCGVQQAAVSSDYADEAVDAAEVQGATAVVYEQVGVGQSTLDWDAYQAALASVANPESPIQSVEIEPVAEIQGGPAIAAADDEPYEADLDGSNEDLTADYLRGARDAFDMAYQKMALQDSGFEGAAADQFANDSNSTWGLQAVGALNCGHGGSGTRVAILDTGMDLNHQDFEGRAIVSRSFIQGEAVDDGNGHGTHCTGTACGPLTSRFGRRYGVAYDSEIYIGKVLGNNGSSRAGSIISGMNWAIAQNCHVISMSLRGLGGPVNAYTVAGQSALDAGLLIVAASGNDSNRRSSWRHRGLFGRVRVNGTIRHAGSPANSPTVLSVGGIDSSLAIYVASNRGVDLAAPGVNVYSSVPGGVAGGWNGTSMATPHVAGVAALVRSETGKSGRDLWRHLESLARALPHPTADVGSGLVQTAHA